MKKTSIVASLLFAIATMNLNAIAAPAVTQNSDKPVVVSSKTDDESILLGNMMIVK